METVELSNFVMEVYTLRRLKKYFGATYEKYMDTSHLVMPLVFLLRDQNVFKIVFAWHLRKTGSYIMTLLHLLLHCCRMPFSSPTSTSSFKVILTFQQHSITVENTLLLYDHSGPEEQVKKERILQRTEVKRRA